MAITVGNVTTQADNESGTPLTFAHNNNGDYLVVDVAQGYTDSSGAPTGVTYNGAAMTLLGSKQNATSGRWSSQWGRIAPTSGSNNVAVSWNAYGAVCFVTARSFSGVHQTVPVGTTVTAEATSTAITVTVTSASGELVIDGCAVTRAGGAVTITVDGSQAQDSNGVSSHATDTLNQTAATSHEDGAASTVMSATASASRSWVTIGTPLKPAATGPKAPLWILNPGY
jgi:hypothetical protein